MDKRRKELLGRLAVWAFDHGQKFFRTPDVEVAERRGERIGMLWYRLDRKHRVRAHKNLELAFPEWTPERRHETAKNSFRHYGRVMGDFLRSPIRTDAEVRESASVEGVEHFEAATAMGKGLIGITGHVGNFERFGHYMAATGHKITVVARNANQSALQERIEAVRLGTGVGLVSRGEAALPIIRRLRRGEIVGIMPDQNDDECFVPFFGKPAGTVLGPGVIHERTGAPILPGFCVRVGPGRYRMIFRRPIGLGGNEKNPVAIMAAINDALEAIIREYPEQWLWMHDRWKSARMRGMLD